jgi:chromosome segregation ATPase
MDDEIRSELTAVRASMDAGFAALRESMTAGFARVDHFLELQQVQHLDLRGEVQDLRGDVQELRGDVQELRGEVQELRGEVRELRAMLLVLIDRVDRIEIRLATLDETVQRLDSEVRSLRDWATREFAEVRGELRRMRSEAAGRDEALRRDVDALTARVDRLERRLEQR